jgi:hypothetical protein
MKLVAGASAVVLTLASTVALAQSENKTLTSIPDSVTVTDFYKQNVYDPGENKIGSIEDVLVDQAGKVTAFIVAVGGFLGVGEKDVATPFNAIKAQQKDGKWYLTMSANKDELKAAPGFKYDRSQTKWVPETAAK